MSINPLGFFFFFFVCAAFPPFEVFALVTFLGFFAEWPLPPLGAEEPSSRFFPARLEAISLHPCNTAEENLRQGHCRGKGLRGRVEKFAQSQKDARKARW